jgi:hypothetical protein
VLTFIDFYPGAPVAIRYILCLFPNTGLMFCLLVIQQYERNSGSLFFALFIIIIISTKTFRLDGMATFEQLYSNIFNYPLYIGICLLLMLVYSFIYMILAVYVERINPGEFGIAQPWYFVFKQICYKQKRIVTGTPFNSLQNSNQTNNTVNTANQWIDLKSMVNEMRPSISIMNLTKVRFIIV